MALRAFRLRGCWPTIKQDRITMEFRQTTTYVIEPRPGGGFVAKSSDGSVAPVEAATREELQQKIEAQLDTDLASDLKDLLLASKENSLSQEINTKPGSILLPGSASPGAKLVEYAAPEDLKRQIEEQLSTVVGKDAAARLSQDIKLQLQPGKLKFLGAFNVTRVNTTGKKIITSKFSTDGFSQASAAKSALRPITSMGDSPIAPARTSNWVIFCFLLALGAIASAVYFFLHK